MPISKSDVIHGSEYEVILSNSKKTGTAIAWTVNGDDDLYWLQNFLDGASSGINNAHAQNAHMDKKHSWAHESGDTIIKKTNQLTSMNLLQSFNNLFLKEPEKSFRKAGITGEDGTLTNDGQKVFLTWLLAQNGDAFKAAVVDPILAEQEAEKK